ncbi:tryptophan halogenase [Sphingomonas sp. BE138]|uniref:tryptophan halogenase family protein n=1 Tax=Sphingomonas sp. BE138 TaxID=2817845 RepID=UPI002864079C|nr:tryptophan 7-halogenase [Sphingomonas sp. BE138]MDR6790337.1 tryptophan halogenase [Sphingomonas sp. BE138]
MSAGRVRSVVIAGGGTAGWMAAALLSHRLAPLGIAITLVESTTIGTVGVGEATTPAIRDFFAEAGLDEAEVMRASNATAKLGILFDGWAGDDSRFFHPFGLYGTPSNGVDFHQYWSKLRAGGNRTTLDQFSLASQLALGGRMMTPLRPAPDYAFFDWAVHFDAALFARHLREVAEARGVTRVDARIERVERCGDTGRLLSLHTDTGARISGDLFIDCTGFRALLAGETLAEPYDDWRTLLPVDRAVAIPCAYREDAAPIEPYTRVTARSAGWRWRIPLRHRIGNGYVYASSHLSDDEAAATLRATLEGEALAEPNLLRFTTGRRQRAWVSNCVALGLAAGFLEPLESTSITLIYSGLQRLLALFPDDGMDPALADEYNRITRLEYERVRDFLVLHYWANGRSEPFWLDRRATPLPDALAHKIRLFEARGRMVRMEWETFADPSWLAIFVGLGIMPKAWDPLADGFTSQQIESAFGRMTRDVAKLAASAPTHRAWLAAMLGEATG